MYLKTTNLDSLVFFLRLASVKTEGVHGKTSRLQPGLERNLFVPSFGKMFDIRVLGSTRKETREPNVSFSFIDVRLSRFDSLVILIRYSARVPKISISKVR